MTHEAHVAYLLRLNELKEQKIYELCKENARLKLELGRKMKQRAPNVEASGKWKDGILPRGRV